MTTLFMLTDDKLGGAQKNCLMQAEYLKKRGVDARVVEITQWRSPLKRRGYLHYLISFVNMTRGLLKLHRENPDAIFFAVQFSATIGCFVLGIPCHTRFANDSRRSIGRLRWIIFSRIFLFHPQSRLYFLHKALLDDAPAIPQRHRHKLRVIENPAPQLPLRPYPFKKDKPIDAVYVGRFSKAEKNPAGLARLLKAIDFPFARLRLYGEGPDKSLYEKLLGEFTNPEFVEWQKNPWGAIDRASVIFITSHYEAIPTVLHESFASGFPVISTCPSPATRFMLSQGRGLDLAGMDEAEAAKSAQDFLNDTDALNACRKKARAWIEEKQKRDYGAYFMQSVPEIK